MVNIRFKTKGENKGETKIPGLIDGYEKSIKNWMGAFTKETTSREGYRLTFVDVKGEPNVFTPLN